MIPYLEQPHLTLGGWTFYPFGFFVGLASLAGAWLLIRRASRELDAAIATKLTLYMIGWGYLGSHVTYLLLFDQARLYAHPWILLNPNDGIYSFGGIVSGLLTVALLSRRYGLSRQATLRYVDHTAYVFPTAWAIARTGCSLAHDHPGLPSTSWLAVRFPAGPRFDLGLIELLFTLGMVGLWRFFDHRPRPAPFFVGLFFLLYGPFRIWLDQLRDPPSIADRTFGLISIVCGAAALVFAAHEASKASSGT